MLAYLNAARSAWALCRRLPSATTNRSCQPLAGWCVFPLVTDAIGLLAASGAIGGGRVDAAVDLAADREGGVRALFAAHYVRLVGLARLLVDDVASAEAVAQDAFTALHRDWPRLRDRGACLSYLETQVVQGAHRRRGQRKAGCAADGSDELIDGLARLPYRQRQVMVLRYYLDLTEAEVADRLNIGRGTVDREAAQAIASLGLASAPDQ